MATFDACDSTTSATPVRWRWVLAGLAPGLLSVALFAGYILTWLALRGHPSSELAGKIAMGALYTAMWMPCTFPLHLFLIGRRYVRVVHAGHKPVLPFVLMYGMLNLLLWGAGALLLVGSMGWR